MSEVNKVVQLTSARRKAKKDNRKKTTTLCREGHHKWQADKQQQFDVKLGKLVTVLICQRCGKRKNKLT